MVTDDQRERERQKYVALLGHPTYGGKNHGLPAIPFIQTIRPRALLDLGCGRNKLCKMLRESGEIGATGVDFAFPDADIIAPMHRVPVADRSADCITAFDSLEHLLPEEVDEVIDEMNRIARPGARFVATIASFKHRDLHPTVRPLEWWLRKLSRVMRIDQRKPFVVGTFGGVVHQPLHPADVAAISVGSRQQRTDGMSVWTTDYRPACLTNWLRGRHAFLVCSGPSLPTYDLARLNERGIVSMGVNNSWLVHRPTLWTCVDHPNRFSDTGWKDAGIVKFVPAQHAEARLRVQLSDGAFRRSQFKVSQMPSVWLYRRSEGFDHERFVGQPAVPWGCPSEVVDSVGINGKRSVFQAALGLLTYLGASNVYLVGADFRMQKEFRYGFDEERSEGEIRHNNVLYECLNERLSRLRPHLEREGIRVWNATPGSSLTAFDTIDYDEAVERASAEASKPVSPTGWY